MDEIAPYILKAGNCGNIFVTTFFIILVLLKGDYDVSSKTSRNCVIAIVLIVVVSTFTTGLLKLWNNRQDRILKTPVLIKCARDMKLGCAGMLIFAIIPCVVTIFVHNSGAVYFSTISSCNISSIVIYYMFISQANNSCRLLIKPKHFYKAIFIDFIWLFLVFVLCLLTQSQSAISFLGFSFLYSFAHISIVVSLWCAMTDRIETRVIYILVNIFNGKKLKSVKKGCMERTGKDRRMLAVNESKFSKINETSPLSEIIKRLTGLENEQDFEQARKFLKSRVLEVVKADVKQSPLQVLSVFRSSTEMEETSVDEENISASESNDVETNVVCLLSPEPTGMICEMCMVKYDKAIEIQTPRILIKCGHTMCHGCIEYILSRQDQPKIICPFCQKVTAIIGENAQSLPRNYAVLKMMNGK